MSFEVEISTLISLGLSASADLKKGAEILSSLRK